MRPIGFTLDPSVVEEAPGVTIRRTIGSDRLVFLDPVLLLDHVASRGDAEAGFPRHPHRGIETLTLVLKGWVRHRDSASHEGEVGPGGAQWMTAGQGIWHEEMLRSGEGGAEIVQLWFNLPAAMRNVAPGYCGAQAEEIPTVTEERSRARVIAGHHHGHVGPFSGIATRPTVLDVTLDPDGQISVPTDPKANALLYVVHGSASVGGASQPGPRLVVLGRGDQLEVANPGPEPVRFVVVAAKPLNQPLVQYRSFVVGSVDEVRETLAAVENGTFAAEQPVR